MNTPHTGCKQFTFEIAGEEIVYSQRLAWVSFLVLCFFNVSVFASVNYSHVLTTRIIPGTHMYEAVVTWSNADFCYLPINEASSVSVVGDEVFIVSPGVDTVTCIEPRPPEVFYEQTALIGTLAPAEYTIHWDQVDNISLTTTLVKEDPEVPLSVRQLPDRSYEAVLSLNCVQANPASSVQIIGFEILIESPTREQFPCIFRPPVTNYEVITPLGKLVPGEYTVTWDQPDNFSWSTTYLVKETPAIPSSSPWSILLLILGVSGVAALVFRSRISAGRT